MLTSENPLLPPKILSPAQAFDEVAEEYDSFYQETADRAEDAVVASLLRNKIYTHGRLLDVGCGTGWVLDHLSIDPKLYTGIDPSHGMLCRAREKHPSAQFLPGVAEDLRGLSSETFDAVVSVFEAISYSPNPMLACAEMLRVLKPGGRFLLMPAGLGHGNARIFDSYGLCVSKKRWSVEDAHAFLPTAKITVQGFGASDSLLLCLGFQDARTLLDLELRVTAHRFLDACRYLVITGRRV